MAKNRIGIDVGGTNVKLALVSPEGKIIYSNSIPTHAEMGYEYTVDNIKQAIKDLMKETDKNSNSPNKSGSEINININKYVIPDKFPISIINQIYHYYLLHHLPFVLLDLFVL